MSSLTKQNGQIIIITGGNRGMGYEYVKQYSENKFNKIIVTCRNPSKAHSLNLLASGNSQIHIIQCENTCDKSVSSFAEQFKKLGFTYFDLFISNAGTFCFNIKNFEQNSSERMLELYNINAVGPFRLFNNLKKFLRKEGTKSKAIFVSSSYGSFGVTETAEYTGYKMSRVALNMLVKDISKTFRVLAISIHPRTVNTKDILKKWDFLVDEAVSNLIQTYKELDDSKNGKFLWYDGTVKPY